MLAISSLNPNSCVATFATRESHVKVFDIAGRPMKNWVMVELEVVEEDNQLKEWLRRAEAFIVTLRAKRK